MEQYLTENTWLVIVAGLWTLPWTGIALWIAARRGEKWWFIALLLIQTVGILEIVYIFVFSKKKKQVNRSAESI